MPVTDYICGICKRQILINYLEGPGEIVTACASDHKIKVTTNNDGYIVNIEEIKDAKEEPKKKNPWEPFYKAVGKWTIVILIGYLIFSLLFSRQNRGPIIQTLFDFISEVFALLGWLILSILRLIFSNL